MPRKKSKIQYSKNLDTSSTDLNNDVNIKKPEIRTVMTIFREIHDIQSHERLLTQLMLEFYNKLPIDEFCQDFFECMRYIMIYQDRIKTENPLLFCVKFVIMCLKKDSENNNNGKGALLLKRIVKFITFYENSVDSNVRFHSVQTARLLLTELTDEVPVSDTIFEKVQTLLLKRFWDVKSFVRAEAAQASSRLQDPSDGDCPIVVALMHLSRFDGCHKVRLAAMQALAITTKTLPCIIARSRDVSDLVRRKSFDLMAKWKILKPLTVSKRLQIVEAGLNDKADIVKSACGDLLKVWLSACNNDPVLLLKRFDVENKEDVTEMAFNYLLKRLDCQEVVVMIDHLKGLLDDRFLIREEYLSAEAAFLWKNLVMFINERNEEYGDYLDNILPCVVDFEQYLRRLFQKPIEQNIQKEISLDEYAEYCAIIKQLLPIVKYIDIFDTFNRKKIIDLIKWAMSSPDIPFNYVEHLMKLLVHLESNNVKICNETVALINELLFDNDNVDGGNKTKPGDNVELVADSNVHLNEAGRDHTVINMEALRKKRIEIAELDVKLNELKEMINTYMQAKEFDGVQSLVNELKILESRKSQLILLKDQLITPVANKMMQEIVNETVEGTPAVKIETQELPLWMNSGMESRIIKANIMTISMIQECNLLWSMPPSLRSLFDNVILISIRHTDACVRQKAILSLGLCCLLDKELALKYYPIFLKSLEVDHDPIKEVATKSLIDLFIRFGVEPFQECLIAAKENSKMLEQSSIFDQQPIVGIKEESYSSFNTLGSVTLTEDEQNKCVLELINPIINLLNSDKTELQTIACIGLSKLLYHHKLMSSKLLSRLLLLWFNPESENNVVLRQHLGGFFSNYTLMSTENQEAITNCFLITMKYLFKAPASSPLSEVDITNVVDFFLRVTDSKYLLENRIGANNNNNKTDENNNNNDNSNTATTKDFSLLDSIRSMKELDELENPCHNELAIITSSQILRAPLSSETKYYVAMLVRLRLSTNNQSVIINIEEMVSTMLKKLKDKKSLQLLEKFHKELLLKLNIQSQLEHTPPSAHVTQTPASKPILLEVNTVGKPQDGRFLSHTIISADNTVSNDDSVISSINMNDTLIDLTIIAENQLSEIGGENESMCIDNSPEKIRDDDIFKKPSNVRVTRSSSRMNSSSISQSSKVIKNKSIEK